MKSNTIAAFLTLMLLVIYPLVMGIQTDASRDLARFIPQSSLVYFEQRNGSNALKEFTKSPLGKKIQIINFLETGKKIGIPDSVLTAVHEVVSHYTSVKENKLVLMKFLAKGLPSLSFLLWILINRLILLTI